MAAVADAMSQQQQPNANMANSTGGAAQANAAGAASNAAGVPAGAPQQLLPSQLQPQPAAQKASNVASLYVGDLHKDVTEAQLYELFSKIGNVISIRVCRDMITRRSLGYAYVNFQNAPDAEKAMDSLNFEPLRSKPIRIMWSHRDPSLRRSGVGNIFIRNLHKAIDNKALYDTFSAFGNILSCKIVTDENSDSKGYGFVHFETEEAANRAIDKINGMQLDAQIVFVGKFVPKNEREKTFTNCYVKNLPDNVDDQGLRDLFKAYGDITNATVMVDDNNKSRGFGFVSFTKHEAAERAVQATNGKDVNGRILYVARAQKKGERQQELFRAFEQKRVEAQKQSANANLYVKNIEDGLDEERLRREFATFGAIKSCKIMKDEHGRSKGFGFISYTQPQEAQAALQHMQGRTIITKPLYVAIAQRKEERTAMIQSHVQSRMMPSPSAAGAFRLPPGVVQPPNAMQAQQMAALQAAQFASLLPYANPQMAAALQALSQNPAAAAAFAVQQAAAAQQNSRGFGGGAGGAGAGYQQNLQSMAGMRGMNPLAAQQQWQQQRLAASGALGGNMRGGAGGQQQQQQQGGAGPNYSLNHVAAAGQQQQQGGGGGGSQFAQNNAAMIAAANAAILAQQQQAGTAAQQQQGGAGGQQQMSQQQLGGQGGMGAVGGGASGGMRNVGNMPQVTRTYGGQQNQQNQQRMGPGGPQAGGRPGGEQQYGSQQQSGQMQQRGMAQQQQGGAGGMRGASQQQNQQQQQGVRGTSVGRPAAGGQPGGANVNGPSSGGGAQAQQGNAASNNQQPNGNVEQQPSPASPKSYAGAAAQQAPAGPQPASMRQQPPQRVPAGGSQAANAASAAGNGKAPASDIIDAAKLATMDKSMQKTVLGEKLYPKIREICPDFVGKITGMLLESMDSSDLLLMIEDSGFDFMKKKVDEAAKLLRANLPKQAGAAAAAGNATTAAAAAAAAPAAQQASA